jgi:hypothetical protein
MMFKSLTVIAIIALVVALIVAGPILIIWALNTLFPVLAIPYTIWTWLAALILGATVGPSVKVRK